MILHTILKRTLKLFHSEKTSAAQQAYFDNGAKNLSNSSIKLDFRQGADERKYIRLGKDSSVIGTVIFETRDGFVDIANRVFIGGATFICRSSIIIEENVQIAWGVTLYDHNAHSFNYLDRRNDITMFLENINNSRNPLENKNWDVVKTAPIKICRDAWIGMNCIILNGVTIGEGAIIGAGSVVRTDIPPWTIATGNPAVVLSENRYKSI